MTWLCVAMTSQPLRATADTSAAIAKNIWECGGLSAAVTKPFHSESKLARLAPQDAFLFEL